MPLAGELLFVGFEVLPIFRLFNSKYAYTNRDGNIVRTVILSIAGVEKAVKGIVFISVTTRAICDIDTRAFDFNVARTFRQ